MSGVCKGVVYFDKAHFALGKMMRRNGYECTLEWDSSKIDLVLFTGGADVHPFLYGETLQPGTITDIVRDRKNNQLFRSAQRSRIPCVGICRGAQFLNVMAGGSLWQDVNNHTKSHVIYDFQTKKTLMATSTHHQMMRLAPGAQWVAGARNATKLICGEKYCTYKQGRGVHDWDDPEVVFYDRTSSLCFQPHPEFDIKECEQYFFTCLERYIEPLLNGGHSGGKAQVS